MAAIAGPDYFTSKIRDYLIKVGYPDEIIMVL
jgi:hypothetical protein